MMNVKQHVKDFIKKYKIAKNFTSETIEEIIISEGFKIVKFNKNNPKETELIFQNISIDNKNRISFLYKTKSISCLFISSTLKEDEYKSTLLHEEAHLYLGHLNTNKKTPSPKDDDEANAFCFEIQKLLEKEDRKRKIRTVIWKNWKNATLFLLAFLLVLTNIKPVSSRNEQETFAPVETTTPHNLTTEFPFITSFAEITTKTTTTSIAETSYVSTSATTTYIPYQNYNEVVFPINLNTATKYELMEVPGIGEALSDKIIEYRNEYGYFMSLNQLIEIDGIGDKKCKQFSQYIYIEEIQQEYIPENNVQEQAYYDEPMTEIKITTEPQMIEPEITTVFIKCEETIVSESEEIPMIELNSATAEDFMQLPDIDEEIACKIVEFRTKIQYFSHPYELLYIEGMSEERLTGIIYYLYIEGKEDIIY